MDIPAWVKELIFSRDQGICVVCSSSLTYWITELSENNFEHMVPLALSGANDVSNMQLICTT
ncbi:HNH endonuclease [Paenibacillus agricola]|uniref:HNH endonuclease n=1 Tax=Paenibacillus agricola TaxID=2716264 RepID=A0ABX0JAG9_9BACL|nr:HNH endonuclease [Paenibacillus agricola]